MVTWKNNDDMITHAHYALAIATVRAGESISAGTVAHQEHNRGMKLGEPLIVALDAFIRYASSHEKRFGSKLAEDYVLGPAWARAIYATRELLNGEGMKDNGACESMYWAALELAGYTEETMEKEVA